MRRGTRENTGIRAGTPRRLSALFCCFLYRAGITMAVTWKLSVTSVLVHIAKMDSLSVPHRKKFTGSNRIVCVPATIPLTTNWPSTKTLWLKRSLVRTIGCPLTTLSTGTLRSIWPANCGTRSRRRRSPASRPRWCSFPAFAEDPQTDHLSGIEDAKIRFEAGGVRDQAA
jgi:hypothetical protein